MDHRCGHDEASKAKLEKGCCGRCPEADCPECKCSEEENETKCCMGGGCGCGNR